MPIPRSDCPECTPPETCCDTVFLLGDRIRTVAWQGLASCVCESCDKDYRSYTTVGERIQDLHGDSLIVSLSSLDTIYVSPQGKVTPLPMNRAEFNLELRENGWPTGGSSRGNAIKTPSPEELNSASAWAMSHAEKMWTALVHAASQRNGTTRMFPLSSNPHVVQGGVSVGPLTPVGPQTHQVAWSVRVSVDFMFRDQ